MIIFWQYKILYSLAWLTEHLFGKRIKNSIFQKILENSRNRNLSYLRKNQSIGKKVEINRISLKESESVLKDYIKANKPVIIKGGALNWPCCQYWGPDYFNEKYGNDLLPLIDASPKDKNTNEMNYSLSEVKLSTIIQGMKNGDTQLYSRFNDIFTRHPELVDDVDKDWLLNNREFFSSGKAFQCFMGAKNSYTHNHCAIQSNFFVQVYGRKRWILIHPKYNHYLQVPVTRRPYMHTVFDPLDPDYKRFPEMQFADFYDFELEPGDIFYNPPCYWHHVTNPTMSIGFGLRWTSFAALTCSPLQTLLVLLAIDPTIFHAMKWRGNFTKVFSYTRSTVKE
jgi:hypothetical protein